MSYLQITLEEKETPLAFSILCHSNLGILEALLASIFRLEPFHRPQSIQNNILDN